jgi:SAM-dependent methyltransferase
LTIAAPGGVHRRRAARRLGAMGLWGQIWAACYDRMMAGPERLAFGAHRRALLAGVEGRVVEIGAGTGANLPFYGPGVTRLALVEPDEPMARRLERRVREAARAAEVVRAPAEQLPFGDRSFDVAVATLVLCTVADQPRALAELRRVLRPGGRLIFMEHVRAQEPGLARWQDRLDPLQRRIANGCHCNRPTVDEIRRAGFAIEALERNRFPKAPPIVRPLAVGSALAVP